MTTVIVAGPLANKYRNAGGAWERMSWVIGLQRLGCDVYFVEQIAPENCVDATGARATFIESVNLEWFHLVTQWFGIAQRSSLIDGTGSRCAGISWPQLLEIADAADLLVNLSGHLTATTLRDRIRKRAYVDVDPGFTQFWHADPRIQFQLGEHEFYFTIGENIGTPACEIPTNGITWRPTRQPIVLHDWPVTSATQEHRFTTVASWRGSFGPVHFGERVYGVKVHEFRKYFALPQRVAESLTRASAFEIALEISPGDSRDLEALLTHGWKIKDPTSVASDPASFQEYIQHSGAEFSVAQGIYAETNCGWFSDRTVRYLASGKPALVQETGFSRHLPTGRGLVPFRSLAEAVNGAEAIAADYRAHCLAARRIAEEFFDSERVLIRLMEDVGIAL